MLLDELLARLTELPEQGRKEAIDLAVKSTATMAGVPNPGPQTQAFLCEADELFYGGEAGGGKTDLGIGLALTEHKRSLLLRRINKDAVKIKPRIEEILGHDNGYNGQLQRWRLVERQIDIGGCEQESDKHRLWSVRCCPCFDRFLDRFSFLHELFRSCFEKSRLGPRLPAILPLSLQRATNPRCLLLDGGCCT